MIFQINFNFWFKIKSISVSLICNIDFFSLYCHQIHLLKKRSGSPDMRLQHDFCVTSQKISTKFIFLCTTQKYCGFFSFCVCHTHLWLRVHIIQVLKCPDCTCLHFGNPNLCICVETGSLSIVVPSVQGDHERCTCQWSLPALCCHCHTNGTGCSAVSLHQPFSG